MNSIAKYLPQVSELDSRDPLARFASRFSIPHGCTYLVGHSLGLLSDEASKMSQEVMSQWNSLAVESWFDKQERSPVGPWLATEQKISKLLSPFFGANPEDVTIANGLGVNLIFVLHSLYRPVGVKKKIAVMRGMFPQDRWVVAQHLNLPGFDPSAIHWIEPRPGERLTRDEDIIALLRERGSEISVLLLEAVSYVTGQAFNLEAIAAEAQARNVKFIVDVAHGAFVLPLQLNTWGVDAAIGCSYKFGCSGPGGIGLLYINKRHWSDPQVWRPGGWWGNDRSSQFLMGPSWQPAIGAQGWQISTIPMLAAAPFWGALKLFHEAGIVNIRAKSIQMISLFTAMLESITGIAKELEVLTPTSTQVFGSEVAIEFFDKERAKSLKEWLRKEGVLVDYRESPFTPRPGHSTKPGIVRAGFHPMFNRYADVFKLAEKIEEFVGG